MRKITLKEIENKNKVEENTKMKDLQIETPQHKKAKTRGRYLILDQVLAPVLHLQILVPAVLRKDQDRKNQETRSCMKIT